MITISKKLTCFNIDPNEKIAVAVSGGADSMALSLLANNYFKTNVTTITVDHGLRQESKLEALQVSKWLAKYEIDHQILNWQGDKPQSNIQAEARNARYELMQQYCSENGIKYLLVAHNKNDIAENLLMRLMRGSGVKGLSSIKEISSFGDIKIIRPLLDVSKNEIKYYLQSLNQEWIEDPSNQNDKYERVRVRNIINDLDDSELFIDRLAKTASNMARSNSYIEKKIAQDKEQVCKFHNLGYATIKREEFIGLHIEAKYRILSDIIKQIGGNYYNARFEKLDYVLNIIENNSKINCTLGRCEIYSSNKKSESNVIYIIREIAKLPIIETKGEDSVLWDNRFTIDTKNYEKGSVIRAINSDDLKYLVEKSLIMLNNIEIKKVYYSLPIIEKNNGEIIFNFNLQQHN